jgi:hypothetical protein
MHYWTREIIGWAMLLVGGYVLFRAFVLLTDGSHLVVEAGWLTVIGFVIFRGGIHLLKIAVAARICETSVQVAPVTKRGVTQPARS